MYREEVMERRRRRLPLRAGMGASVKAAGSCHNVVALVWHAVNEAAQVELGRTQR